MILSEFEYCSSTLCDESLHEPSYIHFTLKKLSELKNIEVKELDIITSNNFNKLFFK